MSAASAVLVGDDDMVRALGLAGLHCLLVAQPSNAARYSRFVDRRHRRPATRPRRRARRRTPRSGPSRRCSSCRTTTALLLRRPPPRPPDRRLPASACRRATCSRDLLDKPRFQALAAQLGLPRPRARSPVNGTVPDELAALRPPLRRQAGACATTAWLSTTGGGAKALAVADQRGLGAHAPEARRPSASTCSCRSRCPAAEDAHRELPRLRRRGRRPRSGSSRAASRTWPQRFGAARRSSRPTPPTCRALGRDVVARLGLRGRAQARLQARPGRRACGCSRSTRASRCGCTSARSPASTSPAIAHADLTGRGAPRRRRRGAGVSWCHSGLDAAAVRAEGGLAARAGPASRCAATRARARSSTTRCRCCAGKLWPRMDRAASEDRACAPRGRSPTSTPTCPRSRPPSRRWPASTRSSARATSSATARSPTTCVALLREAGARCVDGQPRPDGARPTTTIARQRRPRDDDDALARAPSRRRDARVPRRAARRARRRRRRRHDPRRARRPVALRARAGRRRGAARRIRARGARAARRPHAPPAGRRRARARAPRPTQVALGDARWLLNPGAVGQSRERAVHARVARARPRGADRPLPRAALRRRARPRRAARRRACPRRRCTAAGPWRRVLRRALRPDDRGPPRRPHRVPAEHDEREPHQREAAQRLAGHDLALDQPADEELQHRRQVLEQPDGRQRDARRPTRRRTAAARR